jgi:hypothetical protein
MLAVRARCGGIGLLVWWVQLCGPVCGQLQPQHYCISGSGLGTPPAYAVADYHLGDATANSTAALGHISCAEPNYTLSRPGTPASASCPAAGGAFVYSGCELRCAAVDATAAELGAYVVTGEPNATSLTALGAVSCAPGQSSAHWVTAGPPPAAEVSCDGAGQPFAFSGCWPGVAMPADDGESAQPTHTDSCGTCPRDGRDCPYPHEGCAVPQREDLCTTMLGHAAAGGVYLSNLTALTVGPNSTVACPHSWLMDPSYPAVPSAYDPGADTGCPASLAEGGGGGGSTCRRVHDHASGGLGAGAPDWRCYLHFTTAQIYHVAPAPASASAAANISSSSAAAVVVGRREPPLPLRRCARVTLPVAGAQYRPAPPPPCRPACARKHQPRSIPSTPG